MDMRGWLFIKAEKAMINEKMTRVAREKRHSFCQFVSPCFNQTQL